MQTTTVPKLVAFITVPALLVLASSCSDAEPGAGAAPTFTIALTIEGRGKVTGDQTRIDCLGPGDCGTLSIFSSSVTLEALPETGFRFAGWAFEGIENSASQLDVIAGTDGRPAGERRVVVARFAEGLDEDWPECGDGGSVPDAGARNCGSLRCDNNTVCCIEARFGAVSSKPESCEFPARCARDRIRCFSDADCGGTANTCCISVLGVTCVPESFCENADSGRICDETHPCRSGETCTVVNSAANLRACVSARP